MSTRVWFPILILASATSWADPMTLPTPAVPPAAVPAPAATPSLVGTNAGEALPPVPSPGPAPIPAAMPTQAPANIQGEAPAIQNPQTPLALPPGFGDYMRRNTGGSQNGSMDKSATSGLTRGSSVARTATVLDEIHVDYLKAVTFAEFMRAMGPKVLPGDDVFLGQKVHSMPELLKVKKLPTISYESETIYLRTAKAEVSIRPVDSDIFFEVNHQKIAFPAYANASVRWNRLMDAMMQPQEAGISFLPVAYAVENGNLPTISGLMAFSIMSRISKALSHLSTQVIVDKSIYPYSELWKKSIEHKTSCNPEFMMHLAQRLSEIKVTSISCNSNNPSFELPITDTASAVFKVDIYNKRITETAQSLAEPLTFRRDYSLDENLDFIIHEKMRPNYSSSAQEKKAFERKFRVARMKGLKWKPSGDDKTETNMETGEHIRELANVIVAGNMCHRCGQFFKQAARLIREETDPDNVIQPNAIPVPTQAQGPAPAPPAAVPAPNVAAPGQEAMPPPGQALPPAEDLPPIPPVPSVPQ